MTDRAAFEDRLRKQIDAYHEAALVYAAVKLALPDILAAKPATGEELASALELSSPYLQRFLRGLCSIGICEELPDGKFALSAQGQSLRAGSPSRLAEKVQIVVGQYWWPWANFISSLKTGKPAFEQCFGMSVADWRAKHAEQGALFDAYVASESAAQLRPIVEALDLSGVGTVAVLLANPPFAGLAVETAPIVETSKPHLSLLEVVKRVEFVPGSLLESIPVQADLYLLMGVLHQFDDEDAAAILRNCRKAMPDGARVAIVERLLPDCPAEDPAAIMLDLHMMTISGGRARSIAEFEKLLFDVGLKLSTVTTTRSGLTIVEAISLELA
jgi:O-methyltransferase domain